MLCVCSFPPGVYFGTFNLIALIPSHSILPCRDHFRNVIVHVISASDFHLLIMCEADDV